MAPFTPFLSEELYRLLTGLESVHLCDWPSTGHVNETLINEMTITRDLITKGLAIRAEKQIRVRQPLSEAIIIVPSQFVEFNDDELSNVIADELNIKKVVIKTGKKSLITINTTLTESLEKEGLAREIIRHVQQARKDAGLNVDDRISLKLDSDDSMIKDSIEEYKDLIMQETLTLTLEGERAESMFSKTIEIHGKLMTINLEKENQLLTRGR
jgi:isoleucyl-tRNA synthetase